MPNHVRNVLKIKTNDKISVQDILNRCTNFNPDDPLGKDSHFDFDKIIPEPRVKADCPPDCIVNEDSHVEEDADRPWFDWYEWRIQHWDTKWNAYDGYTVIKKSYVQFVFSTAWSAPAAIYSKLAKIFPDLVMELKWADEDFGHNCGKAEYNPERTGFIDWCVTHEEDLPNPEEFAERVWRNY
jgi:hypothetical protein